MGLQQLGEVRLCQGREMRARPRGYLEDLSQLPLPLLEYSADRPAPARPRHSLKNPSLDPPAPLLQYLEVLAPELPRRLSLGVRQQQASLERARRPLRPEEYLEGQLSQRRLQVEYLEGLQQLPVPLVVFLVVDQSPLQLTMLVSLVELNRHQQVPTLVGYSVGPRQLPALLSGFLVVGALSQLQARQLEFLEDLRLQTQQPPLVEFLEEPSQPLVLLSGFSVAVLNQMQVPLEGSLEDLSQHLQPLLLGFLVELPSQRLRVQCSAGDHRQVPVEYLAGRSQLLRPVEYSEVGLSLSLSSLRQSSSQRNLPQCSEHSRPRSLNPAGACLASRQHHPPLQVNIV